MEAPPICRGDGAPPASTTCENGNSVEAPATRRGRGSVLESGEGAAAGPTPGEGSNTTDVPLPGEGSFPGLSINEVYLLIIFLLLRSTIREGFRDHLLLLHHYTLLCLRHKAIVQYYKCIKVVEFF